MTADIILRAITALLLSLIAVAAVTDGRVGFGIFVAVLAVVQGFCSGYLLASHLAGVGR
jgi:hypothetical protein